MNADFILSQLRVAGVALIAYLAGRGIFTPADATLVTDLGGALGPIIVPWAFSIYSTYGTKKVGSNSVAAKVADTEKNIAQFSNMPPEAATAALVQTVTNAAKDKP